MILQLYTPPPHTLRAYRDLLSTTEFLKTLKFLQFKRNQNRSPLSNLIPFSNSYPRNLLYPHTPTHPQNLLSNLLALSIQFGSGSTKKKGQVTMQSQQNILTEMEQRIIQPLLRPSRCYLITGVSIEQYCLVGMSSSG